MTEVQVAYCSYLIIADRSNSINPGSDADLKKHRALLPPDEKVNTAELNASHQINTVSKELMPETCELRQPTVETKVIISSPSAGETAACLEMQWDFVPQRENFSEDHRRSLSVKRCPQGQDMDPLCSFLMLRAQQASSVSGAAQSSYSNLRDFYFIYKFLF